MLVFPLCRLLLQNVEKNGDLDKPTSAHMLNRKAQDAVWCDECGKPRVVYGLTKFKGEQKLEFMQIMVRPPLVSCQACMLIIPLV
jgi:hypothetical protein